MSRTTPRDTRDSERAADWRDAAACRSEDPEIFFASPLTAAGKATVRHAKTICWKCPSQLACGAWALDTRQAFGVFGGMTEGERRVILRRRGVRMNTSDPDAESAPRKGGRPRAKCGTSSAYDRHVRLGEPIDEACRAAHTAATAQYRATGTRKATA